MCPHLSRRRLPVRIVSLQAVNIEHVAGMGGKTHAFVLENHLLSCRGYNDFLRVLIDLIGNHPKQVNLGRRLPLTVAYDRTQRSAKPEISIAVFEYLANQSYVR